MDMAKILGALMHERAHRSEAAQRRIDQAVRRPRNPRLMHQPKHAHTHADVFGGPMGGVLQEALRRNGHPLPGWKGQQHAPYYGAPGYAAQGPVPQGHHQPCADYQDRAVLLVQAMVQAAKADGRIDAQEERAILGRMGHLSPQEVQFLRQEYARAIDIHGLGRATPPGMEADVYAASLMAIRLDSTYEGQYLRELAQCLRLTPAMIEQIHHQVGAPCPR